MDIQVSNYMALYLLPVLTHSLLNLKPWVNAKKKKPEHPICFFFMPPLKEVLSQVRSKINEARKVLKETSPDGVGGEDRAGTGRLAASNLDKAFSLLKEVRFN